MEISEAEHLARDPDPLITGLYTYDELVRLLKQRRKCRIYISVTHFAIADDQNDTPLGKVRTRRSYSSVVVTKRSALSFVEDMYHKNLREGFKIECRVAKTCIFIGRSE